MACEQEACWSRTNFAIFSVTISIPEANLDHHPEEGIPIFADLSDSCTDVYRQPAKIDTNVQ